MAFFPSFRSATTTGGTSATASPVINLPTPMVAGDVVVVIFRSAAGGAIGWPAGWTEMVDAAPDSSGDQVGIAWRKVDGTEGSTITLSAANARFAALAYCIQDTIDPNVQAPELSTVATGTSAAQPNATTCTPTGGSKDYLWLTFYTMEGEETGVTSYPTNYSSNQTFENSGTTGATTTNVTLGAALRQATASSEDAAAWTVAGTLGNWAAYTMAFHPAIPVNTIGRSQVIARPSAFQVAARSFVRSTPVVLLAALAAGLPPGQTVQAKRQVRTQLVSAVETRPAVNMTPDPYPPGQIALAKPAKRRQLRSWSVSPPQPVAVAFPPGQQMPPPRRSPRARTIVSTETAPQDAQASPPPGQSSIAKPTRPKARRSSTASPAQPVAQALPPGQTSIGKAIRPKGRRPSTVSPAQPVVQAQALPPGQQLQAKRRPPAPRIVVSTETAPFAPETPAAQPLPPGWQTQPKRRVGAPRPRTVIGFSVYETPMPIVSVVVAKRPPAKRTPRSWTVSPAQPVVAAQPLPPGKTSLAKPARPKARRPITVSPAQPLAQALPPGQSSIAKPARPKPRRSSTASPLQPERPPGQTSIGKAIRPKGRRSSTVSPAQPVAQALPPGQTSIGKAIRPKGRRPSAVSPTQPVAQALPPGQASIAKPTRPKGRRSSTVSPAQPVAQTLPPGQTSIGKAIRPKGRRPSAVSPAQPIVQALPPGQTSTAKPAKPKVRRSSTASPAQPLVAVLPPGDLSITKPAAPRARRRSTTVSPIPPPAQPLPAGKSAIAKPPRPRRLPTRIAAFIPPAGPPELGWIDGSNDQEIWIDGSDDEEIWIDGSNGS